MADYSFETQQIHAPIENRSRSGATIEGPIQATSFEYEKAEQIQDVFAGREMGYLYTRISNPTTTALEQRITNLEGGLGTLVTSSGMSAIMCALLTILKAGDSFIAGSSLFGGTYALFTEVFPRFGITPIFVNSSDPDAYNKNITSTTKLVFFEVIGNPRIDVPSISAIADIAHAKGLPVIIDSTIASPWLFNAKDFGADIIVHSTSKYINGSGNAIGGSITDCGTFTFSGERFAEDFSLYSKKYGRLAYLAKLRKQIFINVGSCLSPQNAFLTLLGLDTLSFRMERHSSNALALATFLEGHAKVIKVNYAGLESSPWHQTAVRQFKKGFSGLLSFELASKEDVFNLINNRGFLRNLANIGDAKTLIIHPASTIYADYSIADKETLGVTDGLVRVSVGLENIEDIINDFECALKN